MHPEDVDGRVLVIFLSRVFLEKLELGLQTGNNIVSEAVLRPPNSLEELEKSSLT
jgi:hypothetical protein